MDEMIIRVVGGKENIYRISILNSCIVYLLFEKKLKLVY